MIVRAFLLVLVFAALFAVVVWGIAKRDRALAARVTFAAVASLLFGLAIVLSITFLEGLR